MRWGRQWGPDQWGPDAWGPEWWVGLSVGPIEGVAVGPEDGAGGGTCKSLKKDILNNLAIRISQNTNTCNNIGVGTGVRT